MFYSLAIKPMAIKPMAIKPMAINQHHPCNCEDNGSERS